jgi:SHS2 domain-containing protein
VTDVGTGPGPGARGHRLRDHTADAGIEAWAGTEGGLLEEAALALAEIAADVEAGAGSGSRETVAIEAGDAESLVFAWLNELVGLIDARAAAISAVAVTQAGFSAPARLRAVVDLVPFDGRRVRRRSDVKSATYHQLGVRRGPDGWSLVAYLDI